MATNIMSFLFIISLVLQGCTYFLLSLKFTKKFVVFHAMVKTQFSSTIKTLRSNGGGEYTSKSFESFLCSNGINHQISCPYTPQQNGLVERKHRHLIETTITLLSQASLPFSYWSFVVQSVVTLINLFPLLH